MDALLHAMANRLKSLGAERFRVGVRQTVELTLSAYAQERQVLQESEAAEFFLLVQKEGRQAKGRSVCGCEEEAQAFADSVFSSLESAAEDSAEELLPLEGKNHVHGCLSGDFSAVLSYGENLQHYLRTEEPQIRMRVCNVRHARKEASYLDQDGNTAGETFGYYFLDMAFSAENETRSTAFDGISLFLPDLNTPAKERLNIRRKLQSVKRQLMDSERKAAKGNTVVFAPSALFMLLYQLLDTQLSDSAVANGSAWSGRLGEQVADGRLSISIDPQAACMVGQEWLDEKGDLIKPVTVITEGRLTGTLLSKKGADRTGLPAGSACDCYLMCPGEKTLEELIADIPDGLFVTRLSGGRPTFSGDISMVAKNSFRIENGKITSPCEGRTIQGNLAKALLTIDGLSSEVEENGSSSLPYLRLSGLTVS